MNIEFTKFILKHQAFYNELSDINKENISNLDSYSNLPIYKSKENLYLIYIGRKENTLYFCRYINVNRFENIIIKGKPSDYMFTKYFYEDVQ